MADAIEKTPIPDTPPEGYGATQSSLRGIAALKKACIDGGLTSKYAICAMLGIVGIESKWIPIVEGQYSKKNLISKGATSEEAEKYARKGISPQEHFGFVYGTLKNKSPAEGQYFGRGFIQLTWFSNYKRMSQLTNLDLVNNPDLLIGTDDETMARCAKVSVEFFKENIKNCLEAQHRPDFINKALSAINAKDPHNNKKITCYEYFLGGKAAAAPTNKDPVNTTVNKTKAEIDSAPVNKKEAYSEDRSANFSTEGFSDPEGKYPLRDFMNEPDTNRLARGIMDGTHIKFKDASRKTDIPIANGADGGSWDQPLTAYNTIYPFNKVFESEGGHVLEFDDSPQGERINLYHSKGSFIEIDPNGSQINYIVGDGYYIVENNGNIFVNGACNITTGSDCNILCQGNANVEVSGTSDIVLHDTVNIGCATDLNLAVGGDFNVLVEGNYNVEVGKTSNHRAIGTMSIESTDALKLKTAKTMSMEGGDTASTAETLMKMSSSFKLETPADFQIKANTFTLDIATDTKIKTKTFLLETEETSEIKTGTFKTQTLTGALELKSFSNINMTAPGNFAVSALKVDLNPVAPVVISAISNKVDSLTLLGAPKVPVDFAGNPVKDRQEEQVLVDTVLTPVGVYNPNSLTETVIDSVLDNIPLVGDILSLFGGTTPDIYDVKYVAPVERKTTLSAAGKAKNHKLVVPPRDSSHKTAAGNLVPPERHSDASYKYETEEDWNTPSGQKAANAMTTTSDYEYNHKLPGEPQEASAMTGGSSSVVAISNEKKEDIKNRTDFPANYPLSEHFTLGMFVHSQGTVLRDTTLTAGQSGSRGGHYTKQDIVANLAALCENVMEPIYKELGPCLQMGGGATWKINSGLRNEKTGSDHNKGMACDFRLYPGRDTNELYDLVVKLEKMLPYHQIIFEYRDNGRSNWIHVSFSSEGRQARAFTMIDDKVVDSSGKPKAGSTGLYKFYT
jgi:predicted chitinase